MSKYGKFITSKFDGRCADCDRETIPGERVYWRARGEIECGDCAAANGRNGAGATVAQAPSAPSVQAPSAGDFDPALSWDDSPPSAGASISDPNGRGVQAPVIDRPRAAPISSQRFIDTRCGDIVEQVPVSEIAHFEKYNGARKVGEIDTGCDQFKAANAKRNESEPVTAPATSDATRRVVELSAARIARQASEPAPDLDPLAATVADLLVTLVNCIDRLDIDQCNALQAHAIHYADSSTGSRARLWQALARTVA